jgi:hypothetical protein
VVASRSSISRRKVLILRRNEKTMAQKKLLASAQLANQIASTVSG